MRCCAAALLSLIVIWDDSYLTEETKNFFFWILIRIIWNTHMSMHTSDSWTRDYFKKAIRILESLEWSAQKGLLQFIYMCVAEHSNVCVGPICVSIVDSSTTTWNQSLKRLHNSMKSLESMLIWKKRSFWINKKNQ